MSSTPRGLELQYLDHIPIELRPKPLYGNIVDVSRTTGKCTIVTWPTSARQRQRQKIRTYTFMLSELPKTQASAMLQRALMTWVEHVVKGGNGFADSTGSKHRRSVSLPNIRPSYPHDRDTPKLFSEMSTKEQQQLLTGPRVTFFDEEEMLMPPPLPPKDDRYQTLMSPTRLTPGNSPVKRKYHHQRQGRRSMDRGYVGTAIDIGLVWWESNLHGQRV